MKNPWRRSRHARASHANGLVHRPAPAAATRARPARSSMSRGGFFIREKIVRSHHGAGKPLLLEMVAVFLYITLERSGIRKPTTETGEFAKPRIRAQNEVKHLQNGRCAA